MVAVQKKDTGLFQVPATARPPSARFMAGISLLLALTAGVTTELTVTESSIGLGIAEWSLRDRRNHRRDRPRGTDPRHGARQGR